METTIKYLVDTNIWLERLLGQNKSEVVSEFLNATPTSQIFISDFALHSIGAILSKLKKLDILERFITDLFINGQIEQVTLDEDDFFNIISNIEIYNLDFDDSYQLTASRKYVMTIVTFDKDFNIDGINKQSPEEIISKIKGN